MTTEIRILALAWLIAGCAGLETDYEIARARAGAYVAAHPELPSNTADAIASNSVHDGMTKRQVIAAWGEPVVVQEFREGSVQYWFFGCDWPHVCHLSDLSGRGPDTLYQSRALFENGVVVDWRF